MNNKLVITLILFIQACSSNLTIRLNENYKVFYKCLDRKNKTTHFFSNTFVIQPSLQQVKHSKLSCMIEIEKEKGTKFEWCREIPQSEVNPD